MHSLGDTRTLLQITAMLQERGVDVCPVDSPSDALWNLEKSAFMALIVDLDDAPPDRIEFLHYLRDHDPLLTRIALTSKIDPANDDFIQIAHGDNEGLATVLGLHVE